MAAGGSRRFSTRLAPVIGTTYFFRPQGSHSDTPPTISVTWKSLNGRVRQLKRMVSNRARKKVTMVIHAPWAVSYTHLDVYKRQDAPSSQSTLPFRTSPRLSLCS